ncbi:MAG TPA: helix-hairpin-helix domain-containing protein [Candidatus Limnocylindrales bacterium]|nr:helix-hairpin-helix domain-containing protein [Candidatus Limnocylindrales bacterium]
MPIQIAGRRRLREAAAPSNRELRDLISVGPASERALHSLGVRNVAQLARSSPEALYNKLCRLRGRRVDPCCLDTFVAAVAQARDPKLPAEKCVWWYWSGVRKARQSSR